MSTARPHQFPDSARGEEIIAWKCVACGEWINEFGHHQEATPCPIDWRRAITPRLSRWARVWRWLETRPDWIADLGSED